VKKFGKILGGTLLVAILLASVPGYFIVQELLKARSGDPEVWESSIEALVEETHSRGELHEPVLFTGSSSIRLWDTLKTDMQPFTIIQHGFGGAKLGDLEHYAERLVNDFAPRAVVVFAGSNDLQPDAVTNAEVLVATYRSFVDKVRRDLPTIPIYFIGITPTPLRFSIWEEAKATNDAMKTYIAGQPNTHYIDVASRLLKPDGTPLRSNYRFDGLHPSADGYAIWTDIVRTRLLRDLGAPR
jgi:hypothetical protein